jgi:dephospho-CoA kinase
VTPSDSKKPFRIGLTGGIASGKTTVANVFAELDVPIIDTDVIAREVVRPGTPALEDIRERFSEAVLDASGQLDRAAMRKLVFSDANARLDLENILHPYIGAETRRQADAATGPYQLVVVPLLVGSELQQFVDRILVIDCGEETQIQRLMARDAETREDAQKILSSQASREARLAIADDVINNDQNITQPLAEQVAELNSRYQRLAVTPCPNGAYSETP